MGQTERMTDTCDEDVWVARSRDGDPEAFTALVRSYQHMIHDLAYRMTGSTAAAEDLAQETFIRAHARLRGFRGEAKFSSWLYRIAVNLCLDWRERERRRDRAQRAWAEEAASAPPPAADGAGERVQAALLRVPPKQRAAVVLTVCEGLSHAEAAAILGCREATVSWRLFAARKRLARLLAGEGGR
jgi:RNA polymerase sigma-70 factor, ECF subfamily